MSVRNLIGNLLMKLTDAQPAPAGSPATDPWNYCLAQQLDTPGLNNPAREPAELQRRAMAAFPALAPAQAQAIVQQLEPLYKLAYDLASGVNKRELTEDEARQRLGQAFPQTNAANLSRLLMQGLVGTR